MLGADGAAAAAAAGPSMAANAEDIDLDDAEEEAAEPKAAAPPADDEIQLQANPVPVCLLVQLPYCHMLHAGMICTCCDTAGSALCHVADCCACGLWLAATLQQCLMTGHPFVDAHFEHQQAADAAVDPAGGSVRLCQALCRRRGSRRKGALQATQAMRRTLPVA